MCFQVELGNKVCVFCFLVSRSQTLFGNACLEALLHGRLVWSDTAGAVSACIPK